MRVFLRHLMHSETARQPAMTAIHSGNEQQYLLGGTARLLVLLAMILLGFLIDALQTNSGAREKQGMFLKDAVRPDDGRISLNLEQ